ncbi:phosphatases II [Ascoidea rubescens DSM 1968]|uniref:Phosphatases II n=1 Tax=Ascoidea rubescens DSM 1968 TaxID=1344418 RepID=A0A1D2VIG3_9ASCO|nr:phosphatases II [Ascoidea rubescens DSM 1968]ODV61405.1 phosphatases II [Ascoidea rubescens DSM 1968]
MVNVLNVNPFLAPYSSSILQKDLNNWNKNYLLHEKFENWLITSSIEVYRNIYIGNIIDYNNVIFNFKLKSKRNTYVNYLNNLRFEKRLLRAKLKKGTIITNQSVEQLKKVKSQIKAAREKLDILNHKLETCDEKNYKVLVNCKEGARFPSSSFIQKLLTKYSNDDDDDTSEEEEEEILELEFPASGSYNLSLMTTNDLTSIMNFLKLLNVLSIKRDYKILIYCYDGFTHLSLLSLFLEIFKNFNTLNNSILKYQLIYEKVLYFFPCDYEILTFVEKILLYYSWHWIYSNMNPHRLLFDDQIIKEMELVDIQNWYLNIYLQRHYVDLYTFMTIHNYNKEPITNPTLDVDWFKVQNDNNLPSKILPYLYLGNLNHVNSKSILRLLNIKYIITIGEQPDWLDLYQPYKNDFKPEKLIKSLASSNYYSCLSSFGLISEIKNLTDDDIIEIKNPLPYLLEIFRNRSKQENNSSKVLINCKVGVSRSASLCIAEVMNYLKISLSRAYLYVRVRRLNLIIQPNLKIFYNLFKFEEEKQKEGEIEKEIALRKKKPLREVDWHILCQEIDILNSHYIKN